VIHNESIYETCTCRTMSDHVGPCQPLTETTGGWPILENGSACSLDSDHPHPQSAGCHICSNCLATGLKVSALRFGFATKNDTSTSTRPPTPCARGGLWGDSPVKEGDGDGCSCTKAPSGTCQELSQELSSGCFKKMGGTHPPLTHPRHNSTTNPWATEGLWGDSPVKEGDGDGWACTMLSCTSQCLT